MICSQIQDILRFYQRHDFHVHHLYSYSYVSITNTVSTALSGGRKRSANKVVLSAGLTLLTSRYQCNFLIISI